VGLDFQGSIQRHAVLDSMKYVSQTTIHAVGVWDAARHLLTKYKYSLTARSYGFFTTANNVALAYGFPEVG
jgi:hypothetical protein